MDLQKSLGKFPHVAYYLNPGRDQSLQSHGLIYWPKLLFGSPSGSNFVKLGYQIRVSGAAPDTNSVSITFSMARETLKFNITRNCVDSGVTERR